MKIVFCLLFAISSTVFAADHWVNGHTTKNGAYVQGHYQSNPDNDVYNNYSTRGNYDPYTGKNGTVNALKLKSFNGLNNSLNKDED